MISILVLGLGPHLFVKIPRPGDSEVTFAVFESSLFLKRKKQIAQWLARPCIVGQLPHLQKVK